MSVTGLVLFAFLSFAPLEQVPTVTEMRAPNYQCDRGTVWRLRCWRWWSLTVLEETDDG